MYTPSAGVGDAAQLVPFQWTIELSPTIHTSFVATAYTPYIALGSVNAVNGCRRVPW